MTTLTVELPEEALAATRQDAAQFSQEMRLAAAILWYEQGTVSQEMAAGIAGLDRTDFLLKLAQRGHNSFVVDFADLDRELARG